MRRVGFRPTREKQLHLTLAFIPDVPPSKVSGLRIQLEEALQGKVAPVLHFGEVGLIGGNHAARVLMLEVHATPELLSLSQTVRTVLDHQGVDYDHKPFRGHVTLGRSKDEVGKRDWERLTHDIELPRVPPSKVEEIELIHSELTTTGSVYTKLFHIPIR